MLSIDYMKESTKPTPNYKNTESLFTIKSISKAWCSPNWSISLFTKIGLMSACTFLKKFTIKRISSCSIITIMRFLSSTKKSTTVKTSTPSSKLSPKSKPTAPHSSHYLPNQYIILTAFDNSKIPPNKIISLKLNQQKIIKLKTPLIRAGIW